MLEKQIKKIRRHKRVRGKISGTSKIPRLCVFRSNKYTTAQIIDDTKGKTIIAVDDKKIKTSSSASASASAKATADKKTLENKTEGKVERTGKVAKAYEVGKLIAEKAMEKKIKKVVFDRGGYKYHGRTKAVAEGARDGGLQF